MVDNECAIGACKSVEVWILVESVEGSVEKFHTSGGEVVEFQLVVECLSVDAQ